MGSPFWLFITDPWETLDHPRDTTLRLMEESARRKIHVFWANYQTLRLEGADVLIDTHALSIAEIEIARQTGKAPLGAIWSTSPKRFTQIHYRVDPPIDLTYLHPLQILNQEARKRVVNAPEALVLFSEKILAAEIPELFPKTLVSSRKKDLEAFLAQEKQVVIKPLHQAQSKGVSLLKAEHFDAARKLFKQRTENFSCPVLLQEFLPAVEKMGETRLWFIDGKLLAVAQKVPVPGEFVINMDRGGRLAEAHLSAKDKIGIRKIGRLLKKYKIRLAAVDWIAGKVTDFNITSPGLIVQMEDLLNKNLASKIVTQLKK